MSAVIDDEDLYFVMDVSGLSWEVVVDGSVWLCGWIKV